MRGHHHPSDLIIPDSLVEAATAAAAVAAANIEGNDHISSTIASVTATAATSDIILDTISGTIATSSAVISTTSSTSAATISRTTQSDSPSTPPFYINGVREDCIRWVVVDHITGKEQSRVLITRGCRSCPIESCENRNLDQDGRTVIKHYKAVHINEFGELLPSNYDRSPKALSRAGGRLRIVNSPDIDADDDTKSEQDIINEIRRKRDKERRMRIKDSPSDFAKRIRTYMDVRPQRVIKVIGEFLEWGPQKSLEYIKIQWKEFCYRARNLVTPVEAEIIRTCLPFNLAIILNPAITSETRILPGHDPDTMISDIASVKQLNWNSIYWPVNSLSAVLNACLAWVYLTDNSDNQIILPRYRPSEELKKFNYRTNKKFSLWKRPYRPELEQIPGFKSIEERIEESSFRFTEVDELIYDEIVTNMKSIAESVTDFPLNKEILSKFGYNVIPSLGEPLIQFKASEQEILSILNEYNMIDPRTVIEWVPGKDEYNSIAPPPHWWIEHHQEWDKKLKKNKNSSENQSNHKKVKIHSTAENNLHFNQLTDDLDSRIDSQLFHTETA